MTRTTATPSATATHRRMPTKLEERHARSRRGPPVLTRKAVCPVRSPFLQGASLSSMSITLYHHPFSRAANVVWALEELGVPYELRFVDIMKGAQKAPDIVALNPMGKVPILTDGDLVVTEAAAIGLYLADRYSLGNRAVARRWGTRRVPSLVLVLAVGD